MIRTRTAPLAILGVVCGLWWTGSATSQTLKTAERPATAPDGVPAITSIAPPGATVGRTTEWTVSGVNLATVQEWRISGDGVKVAGADLAGPAIKLKIQVDPGAEPGFREVRAVGTMGLSNLGLIRVDRLDQVAEIEPNDAVNQATPLPSGSAAWGVLKAQDLDHFLVAGKAGARITIDLEAQRLGTPIAPVVTVMTAKGNTLAQARETPGADHDARFAFTFPVDGDYVIQVRDNLYAGGDAAVYRLRIEDAPFAVGMFPLGGPRGGKVEVTVSGGNLAAPRSKTITLPDQVGALVDPGVFDGPGGPVLAPMKLLVGDGPEVAESSDGASPTPIAPGATANGRLSATAEADRYTFAAKKGSPISVRLKASDMGSWLDSVVTVKDATGNVLVENDDAAVDTAQRNGFAVNQPLANPDSRLVVEPRADGPLTIEVADRYGEGGPGYGYRLEVGPARPDFGISLIFATPAANGLQVQPNRAVRRPATPGSTGALNLKPGQTIPINFLITAEGKTGRIEIRAEGLPPGVTAQPKSINPVVVANRQALNGVRGQINADSLILKVAPDAEPSFGDLRVVAVAKPEGGPEIVRTAAVAIAIDTPLVGNVPGRTVMRTLTSLPIRVVGGTGTSAAKPSFAEKVDEAEEVTFRGVTVPGVLLQGGRIDLALDLQPRLKAARAATVEATVSGRGLAAQALVTEPGSAPGDPIGVVRVLASVDATPGVRTVLIRVKKKDGTTIERAASVIVRPPIRVRVREEKILAEPGKPVRLTVAVTREEGFNGPVELMFEPLRALREIGRTTIPAGETLREVALQIAEDAEGTFPLRVTGVARMPRGPVRVISANRSMIVSPSAENGE